MVLSKVSINPTNSKYNFTPQDTAIMAELSGRSADGGTFTAVPVFQLKNNQPKYYVDTVISQGLAVRLSKISDRQLEISVKESSQLSPFVALKILEFPFINLLWLGTILMIIGFVMSILRRLSLLKKISRQV